MNQLDFVSDNLLSTNDAEVIAKKRENLKKAIQDALDKMGNKWDIDMYYKDEIAEVVVKETFDAGVVF